MWLLLIYVVLVVISYMAAMWISKPEVMSYVVARVLKDEQSKKDFEDTFEAVATEVNINNKVTLFLKRFSLVPLANILTVVLAYRIMNYIKEQK